MIKTTDLGNGIIYKEYRNIEGELIQSITFENGVILSIQFYEDGKTVLQNNFEDGELTTVEKYSEGELVLCQEYSNDKLKYIKEFDGINRKETYFEKGVKIKEKWYLEDNLIKVSVREEMIKKDLFYENGEVKQIRDYDHKMRLFNVSFYHKGKMYSEEIWREGTLVDIKNYFLN